MLAALDRPVGRREIGIAAGLGLVAVIAAVLLLRGGGGGGAPARSGVEVAATAPARAPAPVTAPTFAPSVPMPAPDVAESPKPPAVDATALAGLKLRGVLGGAAIIERPDGRQMLARMGRAVAPGVTLAAIRRDHVLLESGGGQLRLGFGEAGPTTVATAASTSAPPRAGAPGPVIAGLADAAREADRSYVLGLRPVEVNGRTTGYRVMPGGRMPGLEEAGLLPGDVITMVNGVDFTREERVAELGAEIAGSYEATFEFLRDGQRMTRTVAVNPRPADSAR